MTVWDRLATRMQALFTGAKLPGRAVSDSDPEIARILMRIQTQAGVPITADNALTNAVVWACTTYLSRTVAQLPWRVMVEADGKEERATGHGVDWLLRKRPNPEMGSFTFRETLVGWACRWGNGIAEIVRDQRRVPVALWPIHPSRVAFERDENGNLVYRVSGPGGDTVMRSSDVYHLRGYGEGSVGLNVMAYAAESIGWAKATELFGASFFGNGMNPSGIVEIPGKLSPDALTLLKGELNELYGGPRKSQKVVPLDGGMKFQKVTTEPENAQFIETRQHQVEEICRWFGVPPHKVMHLLRATFTNIEHQSIEVVVDSIVPWCKRLEEEADYKLFSARGSYFTKLDLKGLLRGDFKSRQEGLQIMRRNGVVNANEWRRLEEMNEIGDLGDKYIVEGNMTTLERVGEQPVAPNAPSDDDDEQPIVAQVLRGRELAHVAQLQRRLH